MIKTFDAKKPLTQEEIDRAHMLMGKAYYEQNKEKVEDELVQYFIVNSELNMSSGKIAAQVGHVATNITHRMISSYPLSNNILVSQNVRDSIIKFREWLKNNQPKIILRGKLKDIEKLMDQENWFYIRDNGRTEIAPDSLTVIGCSPEYKSIMKPIVKRFQLL